MRLKVLRSWKLLMGTAVLWLMLTVGHAAPSQPSVALVTRHALTTPLSFARLRAMLLLRIGSWPDGAVLQVVAPPMDSALFVQLATACLHLPPDILRHAWQRNIFTGSGLIPQIVSDPKAVLRQVVTHDTALGIVPAQLPLPAGVNIIWQCRTNTME